MFCESFQGVYIKVWQIWQIQILLLGTMVASNHGWEPANKNHPRVHPPPTILDDFNEVINAWSWPLLCGYAVHWTARWGFTTCRRRMGMVISVGGDGDDMLKKNLLALFSFTEFPWTSCECPMMKLISLSHPEIWRKSGFKYHSPTEISNLTFTHFVGETCDNISGSSHLGGS